VTERSIYKSIAGEQAVMALYDSALSRWPVPYEGLNVPTRHGSTFVVLSGEASAPPLVLLHGSTMNSGMWMEDVIEYSRGYRVLAVDLIGEPGRSAQNRPSWDGPAYPDWLEDVLDALGIAAATVVGASQGGWIALRFAARHPERVTALVLICPGGITPGKVSLMPRILPLALMGRWGSARIFHMLCADQSVPQEFLEAMEVFLAHCRMRAGALPVLSDAELQRLTMPVQFLIGARDAVFDAEKNTARMRRLVPQVSATIVPEGGHILLNTRAHILPFLRSLSFASP
jgi:pimeloyl-ACP methyl ester carboxylesterase